MSRCCRDIVTVQICGLNILSLIQFQFLWPSNFWQKFHIYNPLHAPRCFILVTIHPPHASPTRFSRCPPHRGRLSPCLLPRVKHPALVRHATRGADPMRAIALFVWATQKSVVQLHGGRYRYGDRGDWLVPVWDSVFGFAGPWVSLGIVGCFWW